MEEVLESIKKSKMFEKSLLTSKKFRSAMLLLLIAIILQKFGLFVGELPRFMEFLTAFLLGSQAIKDKSEMDAISNIMRKSTWKTTEKKTELM